MRSKGPSNLVPRAADIRALERECARKKREEEQQAQLQRLNTNMGDVHHMMQASMALITMLQLTNSEQLDPLALTIAPTFMVTDWESEHQL